MAILKEFSCKGSYGVFYGMGIEELKIDFKDIKGLVALVGGNGMSKTTVMEMFSPYAVFPSRKKKNPKAYNLKKQFMLRDSFKEVIYLHEGSEYVFRVEIPATTKTSSPEGYITKDGEPIVKGKISEYKKKVVELFGSEELFYSAYFSCQGGDKLTDKTTGEFKQLLIELLGLNKYVAWWHNVGKVQTAVNAKLEKVIQQLSVLYEKMAGIETLNEELKPLQNSVEELNSDLDIKTEQIHICSVLIERKKDEKAEAARKEDFSLEKQKQKLTLENDLSDFVAEYTAENEVIGEWIQKKYQGIREYKSIIDCEAEILSANDKIIELEKKKAEYSIGISEANDASREKGAYAVKLSEEIIVLNDKIIDLDNNQDLKTLQTEKECIVNSYTAANNSLKEKQHLHMAASNDTALRALIVTLDQYKQAELLLNKRPITCANDNCPFIISAIEAIKTKPETEKAITDWKENNVIIVAAALKDFQSTQDALNIVVKSGKKIADDIKVIQAEIGEKKQVIYKEREIAVNKKEDATTFCLKQDNIKNFIQSNLDKIPAQIEELKEKAYLKPKLEKAKEIITAVNTNVAEKELEQIKTNNIYNQKKAQKQAIIDDLNDIIVKNIQVVTSLALNNVIVHNEKELKKLSESKELISLSITEAEKKIAVLEDKAKISEEDTSKNEALKKQEAHIRHELKKWDYTRAALSKSGLQALEIASAAPLLTGIANELLHSAFGGEFYLELMTLDPETGAEILEVMVTREDGEKFPLSEYSGGESVWILQAFKAAQILVNTEKSGIHFMTAFCDEETGALDAEKAERFILMYRAMMEKGGFEKLFYISHLPDCQAMADHSLVFKEGGIEIN